MKSVLLVVLLAAAATAQVLSKEVPDVELLDEANSNDVGYVDVYDLPEVDVTDVDEVTDVSELTDEVDVPAKNAVATRRNLNEGIIASGDVLVFNDEFKANGTGNHVHVRDITVRVRNARRVSAIRVNRVGPSQNATPSIFNGGVAFTFVTIRIRSAAGRGYYYRIQVYAR